MASLTFFAMMKKKETVIPQVRTIMRYGTGSIILFNCAESPTENVSMGDYLLRFVDFGSVQANSHETFLSRFVLLHGMTL